MELMSVSDFGLFKLKKNLISFGVRYFWQLKSNQLQCNIHHGKVDTYQLSFFYQDEIQVLYHLKIIDQDSFLTCEIHNYHHQVLDQIHSNWDLSFQTRYSQLFAKRAVKLCFANKLLHQPLAFASHQDIDLFYQLVGVDSIDWILRLHLEDFEIHRQKLGIHLTYQLDVSYHIVIQILSKGSRCLFMHQHHVIFKFWLNQDHQKMVKDYVNQKLN